MLYFEVSNLLFQNDKVYSVFFIYTLFLLFIMVLLTIHRAPVPHYATFCPCRRLRPVVWTPPWPVCGVRSVLLPRPPITRGLGWGVERRPNLQGAPEGRGNRPTARLAWRSLPRGRIHLMPTQKLQTAKMCVDSTVHFTIDLNLSGIDEILNFVFRGDF